ncbi:MAG: hypothetical protein NVS1B11_18050 [Terriglobales bacterium]
MFTKSMKWVAIAALTAGTLLHSVWYYGSLLQFVAVAAAVVVLTQAAIMGRWVWMTLFLLAACLLNPIFPVPFPVYISSVVSILAALLFFFSLNSLQPKPRLSIASITGGMPGSESL